MPGVYLVSITILQNTPEKPSHPPPPHRHRHLEPTPRVSSPLHSPDWIHSDLFEIQIRSCHQLKPFNDFPSASFSHQTVQPPCKAAGTGDPCDSVLQIHHLPLVQPQPQSPVLSAAPALALPQRGGRFREPPPNPTLLLCLLPAPVALTGLALRTPRGAPSPQFQWCPANSS